ncbi:hypothetical protein Pfo_031172 [Paulownia fortunei]|nr:hypothetical protein Pfo_011421 [Paulownia fortunei]KAI3472588.1 hypothetical protein Pfo_031172 [Paulownia fortunei]
MTRISNGMITGLNILTLVMAFSVIGFSLWFHVKSESPYQRVLKTPMLVIGGALLVVSLAGLVGSCCGVSLLLWLYLFVLFLLILGLIIFTVFTIIVTNKRVGRALSGKGLGDYRLGDYSRWLQKYVINAENWDEIKSCLVDVKLCQRIEGGKAEDFYKHNMSPVLSGCCKPPNYCGFQFQNATYWTMPKTGPAVPDPDCKTWSNVQKELCFDCESCKIAVLDNIKREWRLLALFNICILVVVIIVYSVGCCALRNNRYGYRKHRGHP